MENIDFMYLLILFGFFVGINLIYKKFPKNNDRLFKLLTKD